MKSIEELEQELSAARSKRLLNKRMAEIEAERLNSIRYEQIAINEEIRANQELSVISGKTVSSIEFDRTGEGSITITFEGGALLYISAIGDDATYLNWSVKNAN